MEPIIVAPGLRVNDFDENQYTVERLHVVLEGKNAGAEKWTPVAYCGNVESIPKVVERQIVGEAVAEARRMAELGFFESGLTQQLLKLPEKGKGK